MMPSAISEVAPCPAWDQTEAGRLLANLRTTAADLERQHFGGRFPPALAHVVADWIAVAEDYARDHEKEASRGWDALELLRSVKPRLLEAVERARSGGAAR